MSEALTKPLESKEFRVNEYLTLKLESDGTNIYVNGEKFRQCKYLLMNLNTNKLEDYDEINSIDEAALTLSNKLEGTIGEIPPETEYWGHCSNIQAWCEHGYDTRILRANLAFPLLEKLSEAGDPVAKNVFKDEIAYRITEDKHGNVTTYLTTQGYLKYFNHEELSTLLENTKNINNHLTILKSMNKITKKTLEQIIKQSPNKNTTELNLKGYGLKTLPDNIGKLTKLKTLNLRENQLESLPDNIGKLKELKTLRLGWNRLESLPDSIGELKELKTLRLEGNQLKTIPDNIGELKQLKYLDLDGNQLKTLPDSIGELKQLKYLDLDGNQLKTLPDSIGELKQLKTLNLDGNQLKTIPDNIGKLKELKTLYLWNNKLESLPDNIGKLKELKTLRLGWNRLESLPDSVKNLPNCRIIL